MELGILTYDKPHLKTEQILKGLIAKKYKITLILSKFKKYKKKTPLISHRPNHKKAKDPYKLAKIYDLKIKRLTSKQILDNFDYILVGGSNIISKKFIKKNFIINCHSGLIPKSRGLDSIKWAIYENQPVGITLHFIDARTDLGKIIKQKRTKIFKNDTIKTFFKRHYENEIDLLINFEKFLKKTVKYKFKLKKAKKRMPLIIEKKMVLNFKTYKNKFSKNV